MELKCPCCENYVNLPEIYTKETYVCEICNTAVYGIEYNYCKNCNRYYRSDLKECDCYTSRNYDRYVTMNDTNYLDIFNDTDYIKDLKSGNNIKITIIDNDNKLRETIPILKKFKHLGIDTETTGLDPFVNDLLLLQIATNEGIFVYDNTKVNLESLKEILENDSIKILHNAKFDYKFIKVKLKTELKNCFDTMLAERIITFGISRELKLDYVIKKYLNISISKDIRSSFINHKGDFTKEQLIYAAKDTIYLFYIYKIQRNIIKKENLINITKLEFDFIATLGNLELNGVNIDVLKWKNIIKKYTLKVDTLKKELNNMTKNFNNQMTFIENIHKFNFNSNIVIKELLAKFGIASEKTDEESLKKIDHPFPQKILEYRKANKLITSFGENMLKLINEKTNRIHPNFQQLGADTGRLSCQYPNMQQIPATEEFRSCFSARKGYKIVTCDYSQAELRILAQLTKDKGFIDIFNSGDDLHKKTASQMYNVPYEEVSSKLRSNAKAINFGLAFGMEAYTLSLRLKISEKEAQDLIEAYFKAYPTIKKWLETSGKDALKKGYSSTPLGRKRYYNLNNLDYSRKGSIERRGKNTPIQGTNADITKLALIYIEKNIENYDACIVNTIHDEIVVEVIENQSNEIEKIMVDSMKKAAKEVIKIIPMEVDSVVGECWKKA